METTKKKRAATMQRCINDKGKVSYFPSHKVSQSWFRERTGYWPQEEPSTPAVNKMTEALIGGGETKSESNPVATTENKSEDFAKYLQSVDDVKTLGQLKKKFKSDAEISAIDARINELKSDK